MRFLIATHSWFFPLLFYCTAVFTILKEGLIRDARKSFVWNAIIFVSVSAIVGVVYLELYLHFQRMQPAINH